MLQHDRAYLMHHGVLGMHWGIRKDHQLPGVSHRTYHQAKKDAEEYTRAKMFYGEGAGTRRKLIKARVESRSKADPAYKKAFDHHVSSTDLGKRASQARGERARKDATNTVKKTARGVKNLVLQTGAPVTATAVGVYFLANTPQGKALLGTAMSEVKKRARSPRVANFLLKFGIHAARW